MNFEEKVVNIIAFAGAGLSYTMEAIDLAETGEFKQAREALKQADENIKSAHSYHLELLAAEATGDLWKDGKQFPYLMSHASDTLAQAETSRNFAERLIKLYERMA